MTFEHGLLHLANWLGNTILPTLGCLFLAIAVVQYARGYHHLYSTWSYGGLLCLLVSSATRLFESWTAGAYNDPDLYWHGILHMVDWISNVILPVYAVMHVAVGAIKLSTTNALARDVMTPGRHFFGAMLCLLASALGRLAEFFVTHGTGGVS
jgi:hypothetical protein